MSIKFWLHEEQCDTVQSVALCEDFGRKQRVLDSDWDIAAQRDAKLKIKQRMSNIFDDAYSNKPFVLEGY